MIVYFYLSPTTRTWWFTLCHPTTLTTIRIPQTHPIARTTTVFFCGLHVQHPPPVFLQLRPRDNTRATEQPTDIQHLQRYIYNEYSFPPNIYKPHNLAAYKSFFRSLFILSVGPKPRVQQHIFAPRAGRHS